MKQDFLFYIFLQKNIKINLDIEGIIIFSIKSFFQSILAKKMLILFKK